MTQLLVGTKKGLFALEGEAGTPFEVTSRAFAGEPVEFATRDPRSGRYLACVTSFFCHPDEAELVRVVVTVVRSRRLRLTRRQQVVI